IFSSYSSLLILSYYISLSSLISTLFPYTTLFRSYNRLIFINSFTNRNRKKTAPIVKKTFAQKIQLKDWEGFSLFMSMTNSFKRRSEEHTSELQSRENIVCRLLHEKKKRNIRIVIT